MGIVFILILLSFLARFIYLVKNSHYSGKNRFTIAFIENAKSVSLVSVDPLEKTMERLTVAGDRKNNTPGIIAGAMVDGSIDLKSTIPFTRRSPADLLYYSLTRTGRSYKGVTVIDVLRLYLFSRTVPYSNYFEEQVKAGDDVLVIDKISAELFNDQKIVNEQKSIEIVNGTGINGLGKRLERVLKNSGCNIIAVSNTHDIEPYSRIIYFNEESYTLTKIQKYLDYPVKISSKREIADIKIIIGTNGVREGQF